MFDPDGIVMTASKKNSKATMRLERKTREDIDLTKVHHVAGGPYKGILINKTSDNLDMVEPSEGRLEFLAYLHNQDRCKESTQDQWTLKFWFRGRADGLTKKRTFTEYFQELMNPTSFPKNYIGFMKKALVLLRTYPLIKRVDLEVQEIHGICPEHDLPQIRSFVTVFTPNSYTYQFVPEVTMNNKSFLTFMIKAASEAHISLCAVYSDLQRKTLEIVIGGDDNKVSMIREGSMGPVRAEAITLNILCKNEFRYFWLSWKDHHLEVGRGSLYGHGRFLHWHVPPNRQFNLNCLAVATGRSSHGQWEFAELLDDQDFGKDTKKSRLKLSLLWMAKKQRMLTCLEDAYPNIMPVAELIRQCKIKQSDMITTVVMLKELQKRGLILEVEDGHWMRMQVKESDTEHEVKLVKDLPQLTGWEQPTIAIVTALYCEKLAVDSMIEDKTTFVKYKTSGESQVYTLGHIGNKIIVSTKLSRAPDKSQATMISAENTITRLLGTFDRIQHVLLVGVGGAVPHYTDYRQHVRLGDIVVSMPVNRSGSLYINCTKMETIEGTESHSFMTRGYSCRDTYLQRIVARLRETVHNEPLASAPWDDYIEEGREELKGDESNYTRPSIKKDKLFYTKPDGSVMQVEHPTPDIVETVDYREAQPHVRYGVIGTGKPLLKSEIVKMEFTSLNGVKCVDLNYSGVLDSLEGNRNNSFLIIRGISDYADGEGVRKEWQPYASLLAAGYMKALIMAMQ